MTRLATPSKRWNPARYPPIEFRHITALQEQAAKRMYFKDEFSRLVAEADVKDTSQREAYRTSLARDVENLFAAGGNLVVSISE
jgi:hypothetical protein